LEVKNTLKNVYFGEQHMHTRNSFDAFTLGVKATWEDACRFAMGGRRIPRLLASLITAALLLSGASALAHDARPAYLELLAKDGAVFELSWKRPLFGGRAPAMEMALPPACRDVLPRISSNLGDALLERRMINCGAAGLAGKQISFPGLDRTLSDVLVRIVLADGGTFTKLVKGSRPWVVVEGPPSAWVVARQYLELGVAHILLGFDHLLFVLALLLIVRGWRRLLATVTAFTLAHSITLAAATLGFVHVPGPPVEVTIALSIVFLASELAKVNHGQQSLTARAPWLVAFAFGLLHGFGFAGALADVGLPRAEIPLALLTFNLGVELGQIIFVFVALGAVWLLGRIRHDWPGWAKQVPAYGIGSLAAFWLVERVAGIWKLVT
jgi:hydrogenase/urease accessory protein HupE